MNTRIPAGYLNYIPKLIHTLCGKGLWKMVIVIVLGTVAMGCASQPPQNPENICHIFREKPGWYKAAKRAEKKWGAPLQVPMAIMYQESAFKDDVRPPRNKIFGFIPWTRKSSALGYSQAKTDTWEDYRRETGNGWADRDSFADAIDFMGWFIAKTHTLNKVSKWDARQQYLNYHDGWGGYRKGTYKKKRWLIKVADRVHLRASRYGAQYRECKDKLNRGWFKRLFF